MRITRVVATQHDAERVSIYVDGEFAFACHALLWMQSGRSIGDEVRPEDLDRLREEEAIRALKDRAIGLVAGRPRARVELSRRLARGTKAHPAPPAEHIAIVLDQLAELGLVDDRAFAEFWVEQRDRFRPKGALALRAELGRQGVARDDIEEAVAPERDLERAIEAGRRKAHQIMQRGETDPRAFRDQLGPFLQRRGFSFGTVREAITALWEANTSNAPGAIAEALDEFEIE